MTVAVTLTRPAWNWYDFACFNLVTAILVLFRPVTG